MSDIITIEGNDAVDEAKIAIVASDYNKFIVDRLLDACINTLINGGVQKEGVTLVRVPGAFEIPIVVNRLANKKNHDAIIALGTIIRGETAHFEYISNEVSRGLSCIALQTDIPVIFGVLTVENTQQALDRSAEGEKNKGVEVANTALEMVSILRKIG